MPRYVVLLHQTPAGYVRGTHFDLMLEHGAALWTWALDKLPDGGETVAAERLPDHRLFYLDYEGEIGGQRGDVRRVDGGEFDVIEDAAARLVVRLKGRLNGTLTLSSDADAPHRWRISLSPD